MVTSRHLRFAIVGGIGLAVDAAVLTGLLAAGLAGPFAARAVSICLAALTTWRLNRAVTFAPSQGSELGEGLRYGLVVAAASATNYGLYALVLVTLPWVDPLIALVAASAGAMALSFVGYDRFAFRPGGRDTFRPRERGKAVAANGRR